MEKNIEHEMETGIMQGFIVIMCFSLNSLKRGGVYIGDYYRGY